MSFLPFLKEIGRSIREGAIEPSLTVSDTGNRSVFRIFPHNPAVPDWLPPAVALHRGDWSLIRIFHGGERGAHRYLLLDLREDPGGRSDQASSHVSIVTDLDTLIDMFLTETKAVVPVPKLACDPDQYHRQLEGQPTPKRKVARQPQAKTSVDPPQGWKARYCDARVKEGILTVTGKGGTPFLGVGSGMNGPAVLSLRARSAKGGHGNVEWLRPEIKNAAKSVEFELQPGDWIELSVSISIEGPLGILSIYLPAQHRPVDID